MRPHTTSGAAWPPPMPVVTGMVVIDSSYAVAFGRGGVEGLRPSTNRLVLARGGRAVGVAPGRPAAAGGNGVCGEDVSPRAPPPRTSCY